MKTQLEKKSVNKNSVPDRGGVSNLHGSEVGSFKFQDNRSEAVVQQKVQALANEQNRTDVVQPKANNTGLPNQLKSGIENLSGYSMDDVKVHYNSPKPAQLQAHAYAQGTDIHIASGQEKHLPHEAWHVVQQKQGRVKPTTQLKGTVNINDDAGLEKEADIKGREAITASHHFIQPKINSIYVNTLQRMQNKSRFQSTLYPLNIVQRKDFGKHQANEKINPDIIGGVDGIRIVPVQDARPDDVPMKQNYRLAMHKLHNVVLVLENADRTKEKSVSPDTNKLRKKMDEIQKKAKDAAKHYKASMRDLSSNSSSKQFKLQYEKEIDDLVIELDNHSREGEGVIKKYKYVGKQNTLEKKGTNLWRTDWLKTKDAVNRSLTNYWGGWKVKLKNKAMNNIGNNVVKNVWKQKVNSETWDLYYGGSLMKGYKGPPKQNTRFLSSNFDVDANMDAPSVAEYLISKKGNTVDRGQLNPSNAPETGIAEMDKAMDTKIKSELVKSNIVPIGKRVEDIVSEPFETRVNATNVSNKVANREIKRSEKEQEVRDKITQLRNTAPAKMIKLGGKLNKKGLLDSATHSLVARVLTLNEINQISQILNTI